MGTIEAICTSMKKGVVKKPCGSAKLKQGWGIEGDGHAGPWHRQVSLLSGESIDQVKRALPQLAQGAFAENIITRDLNLQSLKIGDRLQIGISAQLEVTQIGKRCHNDGCAIKKTTGDCIMPREGIFARVMNEGIIEPGDTIRLI